MKYAKHNLMWLAAIVLLSAVNLGRVSESIAAPSPVGSSAFTSSTESAAFAQAFELIQEGKFEAAHKLIEPARTQGSARTGSAARLLVQIIDEYGQMSELRQAARETAYADVLVELEKLQGQRAAANDASDVNDVNDITEVLSVIAKAREFADEKQQEQLMADAFVRETIQEAIDKAAEFEVAGK